MTVTEKKRGTVEYQCRTSGATVERTEEHIETAACVKACGVDDDRNTAGIFSDAPLKPQLTAKLCSQDCFSKCPNIVDLCSNSAAGEGGFLPDDGHQQRLSNPLSAMAKLPSSGAASGPVSEPSISAPPPTL